MRRCTALASFVLILAFAGPALAERPPQTREEADHVVTGVLEKIESENSDFGGGGVKTSYKATLKVTKVERGKGIEAGKTIVFHWFHVTKRPPKSMAGAYGHHHEAARKGAAVRVFLMKGYEGLEVIYNKDGIEAVKK